MRDFIFILLILLSLGAVSQEDTTGMVRYTPDFKFKDGVFITFEQLKLNKPVTKARIISEDDPDDINFFTNLVKKEKVYFTDDNGVKQEELISSIWGYSRNGILYINWNGEFNRIPVVGSICHFIADKTVVHERMNDPYYYDNYYRSYPSTYTTREMRQYLLDFETGKIIEFSYKNLEAIIMRDTELYQEYSELKKRKRKQMAFLYLRRYNDKNPIYFPEK